MVTSLKAITGYPGNWQGTHIAFHLQQPDLTKKTKKWDVLALDGYHLGEVKWFGQWRKYCFFPLGDTVYEETCLGEISQFIEDRTKEHKENK